MKMNYSLTLIFLIYALNLSAAPKRKSSPKSTSFGHKSLKKVEQYKAVKSKARKIKCGSCKKFVTKYYLPRHRALCHYDEFKDNPKISKLIVFCKVPECSSSKTRMLSTLRLQHYKAKHSRVKLERCPFKCSRKFVDKSEVADHCAKKHSLDMAKAIVKNPDAFLASVAN